MRWLFLFLVGLTASACGLSFNPDLPSGRENGGPSDDGDSMTGNDDASESPGDGDSTNVPPSEVAGGAGGAGGATSEP
jgi:hypothetical protein